MTRNKQILLGLGIVALTGLLLFSARRAKTNKVLSDVADEGYETAHDVLYPKRSNSSRTHYGPVLPS